MSPKIVNKEHRRREIAEAALGVFADKGFTEASISEVAKAAGIGKGTVYEYFDSKDELIFAALVTWAESLARQIPPEDEITASPEERLRGFAHRSVEVFLEDPRTMRIFVGLLQFLVSDETFFQRFPVVEKMSRRYREAIGAILLDGVAQGHFRKEMLDDAEQIAINLLACFDGLGIHYYLSRNYFDLMSQVDFHIDQLIAHLKQ
jgi:AcrR family transcriptional regulator